MTIKKLIVVGAAAVGMLGLPGAASAGGADCDANRACIYDGNNFVGIIGERASGGGVVNVPSAFNDKMDSWENKTSIDAAWYYDVGGNGDCVEMDSLNEDNDINVFDSDELSSWRTDRGC